MALIFDQIADIPQLHAFVIGVGAYRHMPDGADPRPQALQSIGSFGQLTSPPRSAIALKDFILQNSGQWKVPLGSVEFLLSPAPTDPDPEGQDIEYESATIQHIKDAFALWKDRCDTHPDNVALFYFCGHGVEKAGQYLLAEDFGANTDMPWEGSFSFDATRLAFHRVKARTQLFFVDACRQVTSNMLQFDLPGQPLMLPKISPECEFNLTIKASARNEMAMGPRMDVSYFTQALLQAFAKGALAERHANRSWVVKTGQLSAGINQVLRTVSPSEDFRQRCISQISDSTEIFTVPGTPLVEVRITVDEQADAVCRKVPDGQPRNREAPLNPWEFSVEAGIYTVKASLNRGQNPVEEQEQLWIFDPPSFEDKIEFGTA